MTSLEQRITSAQAELLLSMDKGPREMNTRDLIVLMHGYWVRFTDKTAGYIDAEHEGDAISKAQSMTGKTVLSDIPHGSKECVFAVQRLPYPATPIIWQSNGCPPFCYRPNFCAGRTSCPSNPSCSE